MYKSQSIVKAEVSASVYLEMRGYTILERNWHRPKSEIDIIARKDGVIFFVNLNLLDNENMNNTTVNVLTSSKLLKIQRSVWTWLDETKWKGEYIISAIEIALPDYTVMSFINNVI